MRPTSSFPQDYRSTGQPPAQLERVLELPEVLTGLVQEAALANVRRRHSHAPNVLVSLTSDDGASRLVIEDDEGAVHG